MKISLRAAVVIATVALLASTAGVASAQSGSASRLTLSNQAKALVERSDSARVASRLYTAFVTGETSTIDRVLAPQWADIPLNPGQGPGRAGFAPFVAGFRQVFPDLRVRIHEILVSGNRVVVRSTFSGTHSAAFLGVEPTGRAVSFRTVDIHEIRNRRIARTWHLEDLLGLRAQLTS